MIVWSLFIIDDMGLFFYNKIGSIISIGDLPTTNIIEPLYLRLDFCPRLRLKIKSLETCTLRTLSSIRGWRELTLFDIEFLIF
ncbi:hypothetical protein GEZ85_10125 [Streptococcus mitis]|uniref:Uncharacterized protein n=1 Tax=Streptococcus mitis TaxID=28037 RepID=A0A6I1UGP2_STRMT|nr:hypothetical protein [Streptococcus mitis]MQQ41748.1 hypothetical protein [Streptococcus mitis]MQQ62802.1 hypothetical protein [Streptococcus mitis]